MGFADGTDNAPGGLATINERGGEIVNLPGGAQVIPHDVSMAMARGGAPVTMHVSIDARGADQAAVVRMQAGLQNLQRTLPAQIAAANSRQSTRGGRA